MATRSPPPEHVSPFSLSGIPITPLRKPLLPWFVSFPLLVLGMAAVYWLLYGPRICPPPPGARSTATIAEIHNLCAALKSFHEDTGRYPTTDEGLAVLVTRPPNLNDWNGPYIEMVLGDKWGRPYVYRCIGVGDESYFDLISAGPDGKLGTRDDITKETRE